MNSYMWVGLIILIAGVFLIGFGVRASQTFTNQIVGGITGRYTRRTMWYLIGGALLMIIGAVLMYVKGLGPITLPIWFNF